MLLAVDEQAERRIDHIEMRVNAQRRRKEERPIGRIAIEEIAVVEIAVAARKRQRLRRLMDWVVIAPCEHGVSPVFRGSLEAGVAPAQAAGLGWRARPVSGRSRRGSFRS